MPLHLEVGVGRLNTVVTVLLRMCERKLAGASGVLLQVCAYKPLPELQDATSQPALDVLDGYLRVEGVGCVSDSL